MKRALVIAATTILLATVPGRAQMYTKPNPGASNTSANIARGSIGGGTQTLNKSAGTLTGSWNFQVTGGHNKVQINASGCTYQSVSGKFYCASVRRQVVKAAPGYNGPMADSQPVYITTSGGNRIVSITN